MKELLEVTNLSYKDLFENISFQVEPEKFITISGANNCGKTTLIRILSGQIPTTQEIKLLGMYIEEYPQNLWKEITGTIIPQDNPTFLFKTVEEELNYTIHHAKEEGIIFKLLTNPVKIEGEDGWVKSMECVEMPSVREEDSGSHHTGWGDTGYTIESPVVVNTTDEKEQEAQETEPEEETEEEETLQETEAEETLAKEGAAGRCRI